MFGKSVTNPQAVLPIIGDISFYLGITPRPFFSGVCFWSREKRRKRLVRWKVDLSIYQLRLRLFFIVWKIPLPKYGRANSFISKPVSTGSLILPMIYLSRRFCSWIIACWQLERAIHLHYAPVCHWVPPPLLLFHENFSFGEDELLCETFINKTLFFFVLWHLIKNSGTHSWKRNKSAGNA